METENTDLKQPESPEAPQEITAGDPVADLIAEREQWCAEKAGLEDLLKRSRAEFDNFRRRVERERMEVWQAASAGVVKDLLPMLDDFERALQVKTADESYAKGVELIYNRFVDTLTKMGLEPIVSAGQPFDPNLHEAIGRVESSDAEEGTVVAEMQKGYNFKGKLLRPAWVQVAVKP